MESFHTKQYRSSALEFFELHKAQCGYRAVVTIANSGMDRLDDL